ncbi:TPA: hypothetical protein PTW95_000782 [Clostridium botulinum]|uniref:hypothetical protein n=1 Tax=Clostridium botulinum TaxID=1491 RepID=UPI0012B3040B|nr:hypothetical protein [Clostridium botulinum]MBY6799435.1 hypothetical protein [Clostridium botulinum]MBY6997231.1 hypothetical protein [Clostridium botulinum]MBY7004343.1 hypothetical protein [Clostridium botulinum]MBY7010941.1 hypothetical protein [Clostridium botulinum]MCR1145782.1 hypothetical protein [Clostridium botulinum]
MEDFKLSYRMITCSDISIFLKIGVISMGNDFLSLARVKTASKDKNSVCRVEKS